MKVFILKSFLILILIISLAYFLDHAISYGLSKMKDYRFQCWNEMKNGQIDADIIINGNSRALSHIVPSYFDTAFNCKAYNLGFGGYPINMQYLKYCYYLYYNKKPKIVIQNVDFITLKDAFFIGHEREQIFPFVHNSYLREHLHRYGFDFSEIYLPLVRYFGYQPEIKKGLLETLDIKHYTNKLSTQGYISYDGSWDPTELNKLKVLRFTKDTFSVKLFEKYLSELKKDSIKVILINTPMYYRATKKIVNLNEMNSYYRNIAEKNGFTYIDYSNDSICMDTTKFVVALHLNYEGAKIFTQKLIKDIKKYNILN